MQVGELVGILNEYNHDGCFNNTIGLLSNIQLPKRGKVINFNFRKHVFLPLVALFG